MIIFRMCTFLFLLMPFKTLLAQRDTIYLDYNWSICEKPVAAYYRICAINKGKLVFYTGPFEDYYINGKLEMTGSYSSKGTKEGSFISYYSNGSIKSAGDYVSDFQKGEWSFYNEQEKLVLKLRCNNELDLTPLLIINRNGDTLLKDGNGKFILDKVEFPDIFSNNAACKMEGVVINGEKDGDINFYNCAKSQQIEYSENFKNGRFKKADIKSSGDYERTSKMVMILKKDKLKKIDEFYHANPLFGEDLIGDKLALDFITNKNFYGIASKARYFEDNYRDFYTIIGYVLNETLLNVNKYSQPSTIIDDNDRVIFNRVRLESKSPNEISQPKTIKGNIAITIDTTGYVSNSVFKGDFQNEEIDKINHYLSVVYGLKPYTENGVKYNRDINLKVYSYADSSKVDDSTQRYTYLYLVENADKTDMEPLPLIPDISAKFPGGQFAWIKYLQKNLNSDVPAANRAPNGNYTVIVSFNVDERGNLSEVKALNDPGYGTAAEAVRVIKAGPAWAPAVLEGKNVPSKQKQAITFQIAGG